MKRLLLTILILSQFQLVHSQASIDMYIDSLFFNAPLKENPRDIIAFYKQDTAFEYSLVKGQWTFKTPTGVKQTTIFRRFTFKNHPVIKFVFQNAKIDMVFNYQDTIESYLGIILAFEFAKENDAIKNYQLISTHIKKLTPNIKNEVSDDNEIILMKLFYPFISPKKYNVSLSEGKYYFDNLPFKFYVRISLSIPIENQYF